METYRKGSNKQEVAQQSISKYDLIFLIALLTFFKEAIFLNLSEFLSPKVQIITQKLNQLFLTHLIYSTVISCRMANFDASCNEISYMLIPINCLIVFPKVNAVIKITWLAGLNLVSHFLRR